MENLGKKLMLGGSMAAMFAAITASASAQEPAAPVENGRGFRIAHSDPGLSGRPPRSR